MLQFIHKRKKAQMELMGLAIVVLLIVLGMFFAIRYTLLEKPPEIKQQYAAAEVATNFINTLLLTSTDDCKPLTTIKDLLGDCAVPSGGQQQCIGSRFKYDNSYKNYCDAAKEILDNDILGNTLNKWKKRYILRAYDENMEYFKKGDCQDNEERGKAGLFHIPLKSDPSKSVAVRLDICK